MFVINEPNLDIFFTNNLLIGEDIYRSDIYFGLDLLNFNFFIKIIRININLFIFDSF
jgi:hypothetical protein